DGEEVLASKAVPARVEEDPRSVWRPVRVISRPERERRDAVAPGSVDVLDEHGRSVDGLPDEGEPFPVRGPARLITTADRMRVPEIRVGHHEDRVRGEGDVPTVRRVDRLRVVDALRHPGAARAGRAEPPETSSVGQDRPDVTAWASAPLEDDPRAVRSPVRIIV